MGNLVIPVKMPGIRRPGARFCLPRLRGTGLPIRRKGKVPGVRTMFVIWFTVILAGLVFYSVVGLTHH